MELNERRIRAAIRGLSDTTVSRGTGRASFNRWLAANDEAFEAYLLCFTEEERDRVVAAANERTDNEQVTTFKRAVELFGAVLIDEVIGE